MDEFSDNEIGKLLRLNVTSSRRPVILRTSCTNFIAVSATSCFVNRFGAFA